MAPYTGRAGLARRLPMLEVVALLALRLSDAERDHVRTSPGFLPPRHRAPHARSGRACST
jgi:hypothetical protein